MSPYFAWKHHKTSPLQDYMNSSNWTGLSVASKDLESLLLNTRRNPNPTNNKIFGGLEASSPDWSLLLLNECLDTFSTRYRSYAGTVVLVVSGAGSNTTSNMILGLSYLTNRVESLGVVCPTYFIDQTPGGTEIVARENPPALPLIFETLGCGHGGSCRKGSALFKKSELCPWKYEGVREYDPVEIPSAQFCALRVRGSKCRLGYNTVFFMTIVVSLGIKLVLLALAILAVQERPLLTVGDAVEEYLENEDLSTIGCSLEWTAERGLECTGPLRSYNDKEQHHDVLEGVSGPKVPKPQIGSEHSKFLADRRHWWREIWPLKGDARKESVPKWDIINYSASMKSWDRVWWIMLHIFTLGVCTGIFTSIALQKGWTEAPKQSAGPRDVMWMIKPAFFVNLPQLFATIRAFADIKILTSRNSIQEFAGYVTAAQGLRVSHAEKGTAQRDGYYFGNMNFLVYITLIGLQTLYSFILSQLVIPQWVNPLDPSKADDYFSPAFHMRFGSLSSRSHGHNAVIIFFIAFFPLIGVHVINTASSFVVRVRVLKISELSTFIPQYLFDIFFIPAKLRPGKGDVIETTHRLPSIPLQMPGPATNSLVLSVACHPHPSERGTGMSRKPLKWGVVQRPIATSTKPSSTYDLRSPKADQTEVLTISPVRSSTSPPFISLGYGDDWPFKSEQPTLPPRSTTTPFTIKRKALASSYVTEVHSEESALLGAEEKKPPTVGHCTFSALEVDELEPGQLYTGILRDEYHAMWMRGDSPTVRRILVDFIHRLRWRRNTGR
ncbi:hypothetical protein B0O99DRAFT_180325 [Bisporella sp. PMI_857]|nr:hypothetical protein B0O99DRAFT_180325 [Bisporella sp. PMI_857]